MDTLVNLNRGKNKATHACIPRSKRQKSNGDAYKCKQPEKKTTRACIPRSKHQTSNGEAYNSSRRKTKLHVHNSL